jgi:hypothetical protein
MLVSIWVAIPICAVVLWIGIAVLRWIHFHDPKPIRPRKMTIVHLGQCESDCAAKKVEVQCKQAKDESRIK